MEDQLTMETGVSATTQRVALEEALRDRPRTRFSLRHQMIMRSLSSAPGSRRRALSQNLVAASSWCRFPPTSALAKPRRGLLVVLVLVAAGCSNSAATPLAPTSTVTSDEQADERTARRRHVQVRQRTGVCRRRKQPTLVRDDHRLRTSRLQPQPRVRVC